MKSLISAKEAAKILNINYRKTLDLIIEGKLVGYKIGGTYRTSIDAILEFLEKSKIEEHPLLKKTYLR